MQEVISVNNMRLSDQETILHKTSSQELMLRAAIGLYESYPYHGRIGIFCGSGNNAGDGYALAMLLKKASKDVTVVLCSDKFSTDGKYYYDLCLGLDVKVLKFKNDLEPFDIYVDCLLGTGFKGVPKDNLMEVINHINNQNKVVISADINSGLNGDSGMAVNAIKSSLTVSIGYFKPGLFLNMAKDYIKEVKNVSIGIKRIEEAYYLLEASDLQEFFKKRLNFSNKGNYGYVGIMGGSYEYPGAPRLANLGQTSLYAGAGVSKLIIPDTIYDLIFKNVLETTIARMPSKDGKMIFDQEIIDKEVLPLKALGVGVGWGSSEEYEKILTYLLLNYDKPLVIDADGLNTLSRMDLNSLKESKAKVILTPHLKEFSRLTGLSIQEINEEPIKWVRNFVDTYGCTLLLKGPTTIIADKNITYLTNRGCGGMATAGSGDVLTGILVGLLGHYQDDVTKTTAIASYVNGYAGELAKELYGDIGMVSSDTARLVSKALKKLTS